jgi:drug/metabolite transporter (DMT)-like permease
VTAHTAIIAALISALLFGASTPFAKLLLGDVPPILLAGLLYLGSGLGLTLVRLARDRGLSAPRLTAREWPWLLGAIVSGGMLAPILLMYGLMRTSAANASLLLNLEAVFSALLAWIVFRENADRRVVLGMAMIVAGGAILAWSPGALVAGAALGAVAIAGAGLCWGLDNNLTRKVAASDALFIAAIKGLVAGITNCTLALALGAALPPLPLVGAAMTVGLLGYGLSLVLYILALRGLGSARASAEFSTTPFLGAAVAIMVLHEPAATAFWLSALLMAAGVWLHLSERHEHDHSHEAQTHEHPHVHDEHHQHQHDLAWDGSEPHSHVHHHQPLRHRHHHYPDLHHRHRH